MKKQRLKKLTGAFAFAVATVLFGAPSSPVADTVPTVGGDALANGHAHCVAEYAALGTAQVLAQLLAPFGGAHWYNTYQQALFDFLVCQQQNG